MKPASGAYVLVRERARRNCNDVSALKNKLKIVKAKFPYSSTKVISKFVSTTCAIFEAVLPKMIGLSPAIFLEAKTVKV
jgi:hypothetical protein